MKRLCLFMVATIFACSAFAQSKTNKKVEVPSRIINADYIIEKGPLNTMFKECVGAGRANEGLRAEKGMWIQIHSHAWTFNRRYGDL